MLPETYQLYPKRSDTVHLMGAVGLAEGGPWLVVLVVVVVVASGLPCSADIGRLGTNWGRREIAGGTIVSQVGNGGGSGNEPAKRVQERVNGVVLLNP